MNILFVCTGNACRSVMAEALTRKMADAAGLKGISVSSCGTAASTLFRVPPQVLAFLDAEGVDMRAHRSAQASKELTDKADVILVMEVFHKEYICLCFPEAQAKTYLFKEYIGVGGEKGIPDPMGRSEEFYNSSAQAIKSYIEKLIAIILDSSGDLPAKPSSAKDIKKKARTK